MKLFFQTYGGAPAFILAYAGKGSADQWDTNSTAVALQNLMLAAYAEGLGTYGPTASWSKSGDQRGDGIEGRKLVAVLPVDIRMRLPGSPRREGRVQWVGF